MEPGGRPRQADSAGKGEEEVQAKSTLVLRLTCSPFEPQVYTHQGQSMYIPINCLWGGGSPTLDYTEAILTESN